MREKQDYQIVLYLKKKLSLYHKFDFRKKKY